MAASALIEPAHQNGAATQEQSSTQLGEGSADPAATAPEAEAAMPLSAEGLESGGPYGDSSQKRVKASAVSKASAAPAVSLFAKGQTQNGKQQNKSTTAAALDVAVGPAQSTQPQQANREASSQPATRAEAAAAPAIPMLTREAAIERLEGLLRRLSAEHDPEGFFRERVSTEIAGCEKYYDSIKSPMWLSLVSSKVLIPNSAASTVCCNLL